MLLMGSKCGSHPAVREEGGQSCAMRPVLAWSTVGRQAPAVRSWQAVGGDRARQVREGPAPSHGKGGTIARAPHPIG